MTTATSTTTAAHLADLQALSWAELTGQAHGHRQALRRAVAGWSARRHAMTCGGAMPSRAWAALWFAGKPARTSIAAHAGPATDQEQAEAAADDLWDALAVVDDLARWIDRRNNPTDPCRVAVVAEANVARGWLVQWERLKETSGQAPHNQGGS